MKAPNIIRAYKNATERKIFLEARDVQSGIRKFSVYNSNENEDNVLRQIAEFSETQISSNDIPEGSTHVRVYDGVYNKAELTLAEVAVDDKCPEVTMDYNDGQYTLNIVKDKSGIDSVSLDDEAVDEYKDCPVGEFTYEFGV